MEMGIFKMTFPVLFLNFVKIVQNAEARRTLPTI